MCKYAISAIYLQKYKIVRLLAVLLSLVDTLFCLVDFQKVCVHAAHYDAVVNHTLFCV